ncbi:MAG: PilW family protein [Wenzhouxiangella sp.]
MNAMTRQSIKAPQSPVPAMSRNRGFSLIEMMVAMLIGLFIIAGVITVFDSNQQTSAVRRDLQNAQEAFRFSSYTISRVVRNASELDVEPDELTVTFDGGPGILDCLGQPQTTAGVENTFTVDGDALVCQGQVLARGLETLRFEAVDAKDPDDATFTVAVRTDLQMASGLSSNFTATPRLGLLELYAMDDSGTLPPTGSDDDDGTGGDGPDDDGPENDTEQDTDEDTDDDSEFDTDTDDDTDTDTDEDTDDDTDTDTDTDEDTDDDTDTDTDEDTDDDTDTEDDSDGDDGGAAMCVCKAEGNVNSGNAKPHGDDNPAACDKGCCKDNRDDAEKGSIFSFPANWC